ncbi:DapH/DapD/GlmU-related protein [Sedimentisphaera salicampi]|uniref:DapH/DapD/GlmU-related protein n=1 Tax=Sedimentisphaera salicampi TaxID=1941349 RepID=UPI000B9BAFE9|nr:DapH/DapD/GlmU-related protein [Sedimentisphaera salicampi]OXU15005.1 Galactoside O-acetyltransferase [Sedimentisphaera salicampi]
MKKIIRRALMKLRGVPGPLRNAQRYRDRGVQIGESTYVYRNVDIGTSALDNITIGKNCVLTGCSILGHDASLKRYLGQSIAEPVIIGNNCFIGFNATVLKGVTIGDNSIVGAGAIVTKDVPVRSVVAGNPARVICTIDELITKYSKT